MNSRKLQMWRLALFISVLSGGALIFETIGLLVRDEAWLVAGVIAAVLLFCIPESGKARDPKDLIFSLVSVIGVYGIFLKFRPWLGEQVGRSLAAAVSVLLVLAFAGVLLLLPAGKRANLRNPPHKN
ncbi:MAG TPA: hypothetical protein VF074_10920 [Pyrinomonadaceae bacterium]